MSFLAFCVQSKGGVEQIDLVGFPAIVTILSNIYNKSQKSCTQ